MNSSLKFHHIEVKKDYEDENRVHGFPNECAQAIMNILSNAKDILIERAIENPEIKIKTFRKENFGLLQITNNAGGIPENIINKIFDPYFTTKHQSQGTGIGLYMTKVIIEQNMNGKLEVKNVEEGAMFIISIPLLESSL